MLFRSKPEVSISIALFLGFDPEVGMSFDFPFSLATEVPWVAVNFLFHGIDILAEKEGITYGIQCKCYQEPVGVKAIQEAYAGKEYYDCMVGAVMTNQYFTAPAVEAAKKLKILLWDRGYIDHMIQE